MEYLKLKDVLNNLNTKWNLEHVIVMGGSKHNSFIEEVMANYLVCQKIDTYVLINWCERGFDYSGKFEEHNDLFVRYNLPTEITIEDVCKDLGQALEGFYKVEAPRNIEYCARLVKLI